MTTELTTVETKMPLWIESREVAEMMDKRHDHLLRDIKGYVKVLEENPTLGTQEFFIEAEYTTKQNKQAKCYLLTKKGCDMVANKMTGEKGILFTAAYVTKFEEMEKELAAPKYKLPMTYKDALLQLVEAEEEKERLLEENKKKEDMLLSQAPKIDIYNNFLSTDDSYSVREIAKTMAIKGLGANNFYKWLRLNKIVIEDKYEVYQRFINEGIAIHRVSTYEMPKYKTVEGKRTKVGTTKGEELKVRFTAKGIQYLMKKLKKDGYVSNKSFDQIIKELEEMKTSTVEKTEKK